MECQFGLLTKLKSRNVITKNEKRTIELPSHNMYKQNQILLDIMLSVTDVNKQEQFIEALRETK